MDLDLFRMGYILAYKNTGDFFGRQVVKKQLKEGFSEKASQISHVEVSGGGRHSIAIAPPVSKLVDITKKHQGRYVYLLRYKNKDYEKRGRYKVAYFSATLCNRGYDIPGVLSFIYRWIGQSNRLWFCSEGVTWALQMVYPEVFGFDEPCNILPAHFLSDDSFEAIWEGIIE